MINILSKETSKKGFHVIIKNRSKTNDLKSTAFLHKNSLSDRTLSTKRDYPKTCVNNHISKTNYINHSVAIQNCSKKTNLKSLRKIKLTSRRENYIFPTASKFSFTCVNTHSHYKYMKYKKYQNINLTFNVKNELSKVLIFI